MPSAEDDGTTHSARTYVWLLRAGHADIEVPPAWYPADKAAAEAAVERYPGLPIATRSNRAFWVRAVRWLAEQGVDQFLDLGTGIPVRPNLHQIVQEVQPQSRVVYVDNDELVLSLSEHLMTSTEEGRTAFVLADVRDPESILAAPELTGTLDLDRPVAVVMAALLHFLDDDEARSLMGRVMGAVPAGSWLVMSHSHLSPDEADDPVQRLQDAYRASGNSHYARPPEEIAALIPAGMEVVEPGMVRTHRWRPDHPDLGAQLSDNDNRVLGVVARFPA